MSSQPNQPTPPEPPKSSASSGALPPEGPKKPFSMLRTFALADLITLGNAACGTGAVLACMSYVSAVDRKPIWTALVLLPLALICDALDGTVARWRRKSSPLGADLDSLADIVSFGVAPAALGFALGMRGGWDAVVFCYFVACGISRLARYNVTAAALSDESGKVKYYEGTPIPTSLAIVLMLGVAFSRDRVGEALWFGAMNLGPFVLHPLSLVYVFSGSMMISTIRIPKP
ncbi:CDP-diacylglycerol--serine O-phosphatidyltransferase [Labilithrix luteola]|uniref:CDP-diacylglycerol--serine O-phosphatidyltransferase n=2 Tax=Labilithrix luteola TaxID=1391654 RepID=A0A0K1Q4J4_9BACT|nr:CDP-alcohol phosphatidyltransferase family protein [Labilithrix luteola]AKV00658.1 CDP-diacylglycerol--serine O-phosphatidyltransferase [Labilithrix luteola]